MNGRLRPVGWQRADFEEDFLFKNLGNAQVSGVSDLRMQFKLKL